VNGAVQFISNNGKQSLIEAQVLLWPEASDAAERSSSFD
jgi:hypothetical protein